MNGLKWVSVVDDDMTVRDAMKKWLAQWGGYRLRSEHVLAEDALDALPALKPELVVLDVRMGQMDGLECLHRIRPLMLETTIVLHTAFGDADVLHHALTGGANGFVQKDGRPGALLAALACATSTGFHLPGAGVLPLKAASREVLTARLRLTPREREFLRLLAADLGNKDIANKLGLGRQYVDNRLPVLYRKLGVHTSGGAVARALQLGLFSSEGQPDDG